MCVCVCVCVCVRVAQKHQSQARHLTRPWSHRMTHRNVFASVVDGLGLVLFLVCHFRECRAKICTDVALSTNAGVEQIEQLSCEEYLIAQGVRELFVPQSNDAQLWPVCSSLQPDLSNIFAEQKCACSPGFTDAVYGSNGMGLLEGLKNIDIARITCQQSCPPAYQSIAKLTGPGACACWNRRGCVFEDRTLLHPTAEENRLQAAVMVLSDNLLYDSYVVNCRQQLCTQSVSPRNIVICSMLNIEYTYCDECPAECLQPHRSCTIDPLTHFCTVRCDSGFLRVLDSDSGGYDCVVRITCPAHHYNNVTTNKRADFTAQTCVSCPIGQDNLDAYERGCLQCAAGKMNSVEGTVCAFCEENSVVLPGGSTCEKCPGVNASKIVRKGATNCSDVQCRPITLPGSSVASFYTSDCISVAENTTRFACTHSGYGWTTRGGCEMCNRNHISISQGSVAASNFYRHCQTCPPHYHTADVGMSECVACPPFHIRAHFDAVCALCAPGNLENCF